MAKAQEIVEGIDTNFLWEVSVDDEFGFDELAREYYGAVPAPAESAAVALALARAPMYFYRKGRGRYRRAPGTPSAQPAPVPPSARLWRGRSPRRARSRSGPPSFVRGRFPRRSRRSSADHCAI